MSTSPKPSLPVEEPQEEKSSSPYLSVPLECLPLDTPLAYPVYIRIQDSYVLFRNQNDVVTQDRFLKLQLSNVDCIFIARTDWERFIAEIERDLDNVGIKATPDKNDLGLHNVLLAYCSTFESRREIEKNIFDSLMKTTSQLPTAVSSGRDNANSLLRRFTDPSVYFSNQPVNVAVYAVALGLKLRLSDSDLQGLALAGCMANIGIIRIPHEVLYKKGPLDEKERALIHKHPRKGHDILKMLMFPPRAAQVALQHHERWDGQGYPEQRKNREIDLFARIISIAEVFNALISARPWAAALPPNEAVKIMQALPGKFDPDIFQHAIPKK